MPFIERAVLTSVLAILLAFAPLATPQRADAASNDVAGIATNSTNDGYWVASPGGDVRAFGSSRNLGDLAGLRLNKPIVGMAATPTSMGYWLVASDGGIFAFGDASFFGSTGSITLNRPVVGMAASPTGRGYWLVASDGGIFAFGDASFFGSTGSITLNRPITGMSSSPDGRGYWLVASDGGIFAFGSSPFFGSTGSIRLNSPVVGMSTTPTGRGYWLVASDGGIFAFGDASFRGSGVEGGSRVFGMTSDGRGGYSILQASGGVLRRLAPAETAVVSPPSTLPDSTTTTTRVTRPTTTTAAPRPTTTLAPTTTAPPSTQVPTTQVPTTTVTAPHGSNPFASGALWVDPANPAIAQANAWRTSRPGDAARMDKMGSTSAAMWIGEWSGNVRDTVGNVVNTAHASNRTPVFIAYNIPQRDCGSYSAGGAARASDYQAWIRDFAAGIGDKKAVVVLEPDALSQLDCLDTPSRQSRLALLRDAVSVLGARPNTSVYIDAGHPGWHSTTEMADRLDSAGVGSARGFSLNVSNFTSTSANLAYGAELSNKVGGKHFIVDTSRNGNGSNGEWCNPSGRAVGSLPTTDTGHDRADALLWLKRPGESDGTCNGGPSAGVWWPEYALGLARSAWG